MKKTITNLVDRVSEPTPPFFKKVRNVGHIIGVVGTCILGVAASLATAGVATPAAVITIGSVLTATGATIVTVASTASEVKKDK